MNRAQSTFNQQKIGRQSIVRSIVAMHILCALYGRLPANFMKGELSTVYMQLSGAVEDKPGTVLTKAIIGTFRWDGSFRTRHNRNCSSLACKRQAIDYEKVNASILLHWRQAAHCLVVATLCATQQQGASGYDAK